MPASRIAFALADFVAETVALLPRDHKLGLVVRLDSAAFDAMIYQLAQYGGVPMLGSPAEVVNSVEFGGVKIERM